MSTLYQRIIMAAITALFLVGCVFGMPLEIRDAQFGIFSDDGTRRSNFRATPRIPLEVGNAYGWVAHLKTRKRKVTFVEEFTLPVAPASWGLEDPQAKRTVSNSGRTATTTKTVNVMNGIISHSWKIAPGDPGGEHRMTVKIEDQKPVEFRFVVID